VHELDERVEELEKQMDRLTKAVTDLTGVLTSGKLAMKMLFGLIAIGSALVSGIYWIVTNLTIRNV
jgi:hypothetical protein